jgi:hypothetical protein
MFRLISSSYELLSWFLCHTRFLNEYLMLLGISILALSEDETSVLDFNLSDYMEFFFFFVRSFSFFFRPSLLEIFDKTVAPIKRN